MGRPCSGRRFWCTTNVSLDSGAGLRAGWGEIDHQTHYWALRQQARRFFALFPGEPEVVAPPKRGWVVVAPSLVVGCVVFDSWIVVASISQMRFLPFRGWGLVCGCAISNIGFVFVSV